MIAAGSRSALHELNFNTSGSAHTESAPIKATKSDRRKTDGLRAKDAKDLELGIGDECCLCASADHPLPVSFKARFSEPCGRASTESPVPYTPECVIARDHSSNDEPLGSVVASLNNSLDLSGCGHGANEAYTCSVQDGRALSPATRALLGMLQGSRSSGNGSDIQSPSTEGSKGRFGATGTARSPLGHACVAASPPPPPSPTCKPEDSSPSSDEIPLQLLTHPVCDDEESQATPVMICNFLQLTLNEPPSSTKVSAETDFMALANQQLFVSELPTPATQLETPGSSLVPGLSLQACTMGHLQTTRSSTSHLSQPLKHSPVGPSVERSMQQCRGPAGPQPCHSSGSQRTLVDAATSPGTPVCPQDSECISAASTGKAASEQAAVELCHSPIQGHTASACLGTPMHLRCNSNSPGLIQPDTQVEPVITPGCMMTEAEGMSTHAASQGLQQHSAATDGPDDVARTPRLHVMGSALSPLLRDACGRSAKSVLKDLLADLVEQERALDAQGSAARPASAWPCEAVATIPPMTEYEDHALAEETVNVVASPLQGNGSLPSQPHGTDLDGGSEGCGLEVADTRVFDAVYDEAVQLHLAAGIDCALTDAAPCVPCDGLALGGDDTFKLGEGGIDVGHYNARISPGIPVEYDQPISPATTRVSTFSVRSALSSDLARCPRGTGGAGDMAAWLCPSEPQSGASRRSVGNAKRPSHTGHSGLARRAIDAQGGARGGSTMGSKPAAKKGPQPKPRARGDGASRYLPAAQAHAAPAWRPACGPTKTDGKAARPRVPAQQTYVAKAAATKRPTYDAYECIERMLGPAKAFAAKGVKANGHGPALSGRQVGDTKERPLGYSKTKAAKGNRRAVKPRRTIPRQTQGQLRQTHLEQPAAMRALAAHMGYDMENAHPSTAEYTPAFGSRATPSPFRSSFQLQPQDYAGGFEEGVLLSPSGHGCAGHLGRPWGPARTHAQHELVAPAPCTGQPSSRAPDGWHEGGYAHGHYEADIAHPRPLGSNRESEKSKQHVDTQRTDRHALRSGFTFSASRPAKPTDGAVANLPEYGAKRRKQSRESFLHNEPPFEGFSSWMEVSFFTLKDAASKVPQIPGVYEWGALPPGTHTHNNILAFYLGKAGTYAGTGNQTLATRFASYTKLNRDNMLVGPWRPGREGVKTQLFQLLQQRGFRMFYRYQACMEPEEPEDLEEELLLRIDYPGNERTNKGYRQLILPDGQSLHKLPKGQYL
eukprot:jgi/Ulvmu1/7029/UM033_0088.1